MKKFSQYLIAAILIGIPLSLNIVTVSGEYLDNADWIWEDGEEYDYGDSEDYYYDDDNADYYYNENEDNEDYGYGDSENYDYSDSEEYVGSAEYDYDDIENNDTGNDYSLDDSNSEGYSDSTDNGSVGNDDYNYIDNNGYNNETENNENHENNNEDYKESDDYSHGDSKDYNYIDSEDYSYNDVVEEWDYDDEKYDDRSVTYQSVTPYHDVPYTHWASGYINELSEMNVINGHGNGLFKPEDSVTKGEFLKLIFEAMGMYSSIKNSTPYKDINNHWAEKYVNTAFRLDILDNLSVSGREFGIDTPITRLEMAVLIGRMTDYAESGEILSFSDSENIPEWAESDIAVAAGLGLIVGMEDGTFAPHLDMTRAEAATVIWRLISLT